MRPRARRIVWLVPAVPAIFAAAAIASGTHEFHDCASRDVWRNESAERWTELRAWLAGQEAQRYDLIWTDRHSARALRPYTRTTFGWDRLWDGEVQTAGRDALVAPAQPNRSLLLVHRRFWVTGEEALARDWTLVFQSKDGWIVVLKPNSLGAEETEAATKWWLTSPRRGVAQVGDCGLGEFAPRG